MDKEKIKRKKIPPSKKTTLNRVQRIFGFHADSYCAKCLEMGIDPSYATRILTGAKGAKAAEKRQILIDEANRLEKNGVKIQRIRDCH